MMLILLCCPVYMSCVIGRMELNRLNNTIKVSSLNLFGQRQDTICSIDQCEISRESKICRLPGSLFLPYITFWRNTHEEAAEHIAVVSAERSVKQKPGGGVEQVVRADMRHGYQLPERVYVWCVVVICVVSMSVLLKDLRDSGQLQEILELFK